MIQAASSLRPVVIPNIVKLGNSADRITVPVKPSFAQYARFKHIKGVPEEGGDGVSVYKLLILDNLIDRFRSMRTGKLIDMTPEGATPDLIDATIRNLHSDLKRSMESSGPYNDVSFPEAGSVFELVA